MIVYEIYKEHNNECGKIKRIKYYCTIGTINDLRESILFYASLLLFLYYIL